MVPLKRTAGLTVCFWISAIVPASAGMTVITLTDIARARLDALSFSWSAQSSLERLDRTTRDPGLPAESFIYLGAGLSVRSDPDLPLIISAPYRHHGKLFRFVGKVDSSVVEIPAEEVDAWIDKAMAARKR